MATKNTINQYIWGYQEHFRILARARIKELLEQLGLTSNPEVFLVGIAQNDSAPHKVCVEPEDDFRYDQTSFNDVKQEYEAALRSDPRAGMRQSHPVAQKNEVRRLHARSLQKAILECVNQQDGSSEFETFCSFAVPIGGYETSVLVQIPRRETANVPRLQTSQRVYSPYHIYPIVTSVVDGAAQVFLDECFRALWIPDMGELDLNIAEAAREVGHRLMQAPSTLGKPGDSIGAEYLFDACDAISAAVYEGAPCKGGMLISPKNYKDISTAVLFAQPVYLRNHRGVRKLLELASVDYSLLCDGSYIYGLGSLSGTYAPDTEEVFTIDFAGSQQWSLMHRNAVYMVVSRGNPRLPSSPFEIDKFRIDLPRFFPSITSEQIETLLGVILAACNQVNGTTVIISGQARNEAERLAGQSTVIEPTLLDEQLTNIVTAIDGGILLDIDARCHAIGVILDGAATSKGDPSRGGRFNSAVRYTQANPDSIAIVISSDGSVDVVPDLRPQVRRSGLLRAISDLEVLAQRSSIEPGEFNVAISRMNQFKFYLDVQTSDKVNQLAEIVEKKVDFSEGGLITPPGKYKANPDMNDSYFADED